MDAPPETVPKVPAGHGFGALRPTVSQYPPAGHTWGRVDPDSQKFPIVQGKGVIVPEGQKAPFGQIKQLAGLYIPMAEL